MSIILKLDTDNVQQDRDNRERNVTIAEKSISKPMDFLFQANAETHKKNNESCMTMVTVNKPDVYSSSKIIQPDTCDSNTEVVTASASHIKIEESRKMGENVAKDAKLQEIICVTQPLQQKQNRTHVVSCTASLIIANSMSSDIQSKDNIINSNQQHVAPIYELSESNKVYSNNINNGNNSQHQTDVIPSKIPAKVVNASVKTSTGTITNIQKLSTKSSIPVQTNIHKVKTITSVNSQGVAKNFLSKVQGLTKAQALSTTVQCTSVQAINSSSLNAQRIQENQKIFSNQNLQNQAMNKIGNSHTNDIAIRKVTGLFQKTVTVQRQPHSKASILPNNVQKGTLCGVQKNVITSQVNTQHQNVIQKPKTQIITSLKNSQVIVNNSIKNAVNINKSSSVPNISKLPPNSTVTMINKSQLTSQSQANIQHSLQIQHVVPHSIQSQSQNKQQPKLNIIQQNTLTSLPVNQKGSVVVNTKIQPQQSQMVLRVGPIKNHPLNSQSGNVKCIQQKVANTIKTNHPQQVALQQTLTRSTVNAQPIKIIQQSQSLPVITNPQVIQKPIGTIKTIPPLKSPQKCNQLKTTGIKTSINNVNAIKNQANAVVHQKTAVRALPQQSTSVNVMVHKNQTLKIQPSVQQKPIVAAQYPQQVVRMQPGQIKTILPVVQPENHKDLPITIEPELQSLKPEIIEERSQSPARRMPLPYECLQFVLQDHNYGAPPPRTPPPATSPSHPKQQPINGAGSTALQHTFIYNQAVNDTSTADDAASAISSEAGREAEPEGEETETAPEGEGDDEDSITRCICEFEHDDGYMICCDRCLVWQHVDCMGIDRSNIPDEYLCEICRPRRVDRQRARALQMRKREELLHSDTLSDTSSTSSADTDVTGNPTPVKKRLQHQLPATRRKSDSSVQLKKINIHNTNTSTSSSNTNVTTGSNNNSNNSTNEHPSNNDNTDISSNNNSNNHNNISNNDSNDNANDNNDNSDNSNNNSVGSSNNTSNNNNVTKRLKREQHPRQVNINRKKEIVKRGPGKRKVKRRMSLNGESESDAWGSPNMAPLRQWIERYEEAVTNHYSPELRARISSIKINGSYGELRQNNISSIVSGKCRLNIHSNNLRFLVATMYLAPNTPVVELRGKYMLSTQHRPSHNPSQYGRQHTQRPGPFVFFYRLPREGTEVCVDTRTYGNDARFVRRSCKPNAEIKHCIEKGTLHLYIVSTTAIEKNAEITIRHEQHDLLLSPNSNSSLPQLLCACGNPKTCQISNNISGFSGRRGSNGSIVENPDGRERRRRNRKNTVCDDDVPAVSTNSTVPIESSPTPSTANSSPAKRIITNSTTVSQVAVTSKIKEESTSPVAVQVVVSPQPSGTDSKKDKKKLTREERKMEAIMKAFERLEKAELRKQEVQARNAQRKESGGAHSDTDDAALSHPTKPKQQHMERTVRRKRRKGRSRTIACSNLQNNRRTRLNSADSDLSSCEESNIIMMQSPPQSSCTQSSAFSPRLTNNNNNANQNNNNTNANNNNDGKKDDERVNPESSGSQIPTAAGLLLALANSSVSGASSPPLQPPPSKSPTCDSGASSSSQSSTPSTPLSSACLLVAAAVGPLAPGFKFPKTKKVMMNEWLRESPDPSQTHLPMQHELPNTTMGLASSSSSSPPNSSARTDFLRSTSDPSSEFLTQSYAAKSLATLVQAANSVSGICDSPPQRKLSALTLNAGCPVSSGSAKKRWLRQAISEECDSPNSRPESPPNEVVAAPPKKRRIARESISSDNYTPPTTPTLLNDSHPTNSTVSSVENDFIEQPQSPDEHKAEYENVDIKDNIKEFKKFDYYAMNSINDLNEFKSENKFDYKQNIDVLDLIEKNEDSPINLQTKATVKEEYESIKVESNFILSPVKKESSPLADIKNIEIVNTNVSLNDSTSSSGVVKFDSQLLQNQQKDIKLEYDLPLALNVSRESTENQSFENDEFTKYNKDVKSEDGMSSDEFDVEAQMMKITGDDGNDYKEKVDTNLDKDKSMDGIEGLMDSPKEDSDTEDRDLRSNDNTPTSPTFKEFHKDTEEKDKAFREFNHFLELENSHNDDKDSIEDTLSNRLKQTPDVSPTKTMFDSVSIIDSEQLEEPPKIFASILPLSERIRKKPDNQTTKKILDLEALSNIESSIDMESVDMSENNDEKSQLSTALRELLDTNIEETTDTFINPEKVEEIEEKIEESSNPLSDEPILIREIEQIVEEKEQQQCVKEIEHISLNTLEDHNDHKREIAQSKIDENILPVPVSPPQSQLSLPSTSLTPQLLLPPPPPPPPSQEIRRLKDPRTAIPNELRVTSPKDVPAPVKRKLSISEYRKRKQQSGTLTESEPSADASSSEKSPGRGRSDSASSSTSSLSSDEDNTKTSHDSTPNLTSLPLFTGSESEDRKGGEEGAIGWSAAPTLVERQRENLTERLKREFGLFLSDDEEERARKQGLSTEAILKARKDAIPGQVTTGVVTTYPLPQLPPQPYIPPPGSASLQYTTQYPSKPTISGQFQNFAVPQPIPPPNYVVPPTTSPLPVSNPVSQFLVPQAPPGSNPYPPQFTPTTSPPSTTSSRFPVITPPQSTGFNTCTQLQKSFYNHPNPTSRS